LLGSKARKGVQALLVLQVRRDLRGRKDLLASLVQLVSRDLLDLRLLVPLDLQVHQDQLGEQGRQARQASRDLQDRKAVRGLLALH
jgi:hypothetical protein